MSTEVRKQLSPNDVGETGAHQAGMLVPKNDRVLAFFPNLDGSAKNPRCTLIVRERDSRQRWEFSYIYYNNRRFGGTRNEYRLTRMTPYLRAVNAHAGDEIVLHKDTDGNLEIGLCRSAANSRVRYDGDALVLSGGWKVISY
jgi:hypothetical protein